MYVTVWEFLVREGAEATFERSHGATGPWVALFQSAAGYRGTDLLRPLDGSRRYLTVDRWESEAAYARFRVTHAAAYHALDGAGDALTEAERQVGEFLLPAS